MGEVMAADGRFDDMDFRTVFSMGIAGKYGHGDMLGKYCNATGLCRREWVVRRLNRVMMMIKFFQRYAYPLNNATRALKSSFFVGFS